MAKAPRSAEPERFNGVTDDPDIKELHEQFDYAMDAWRDIREEGRVDMRYILGDAWEPADRAVREAAGRPTFTLDELSQYVNQIINDVRQNKRGIKVTPLGNGANDQSAALRADLWRQIEYRSNAQQAYTTMFENAVQRSYGYLRIKPRYLTARSRHQELMIEPLMNVDLVTPDPDAVKPALEDIKFLFNREPWHKTEFTKAFPKAKFQSFTSQDLANAPRWVKDEQIMLAEWWRIRMTEKRLLYVDVPAQIQPGQPPQPPKELDIFEDELQKIGLNSLGRGARIVGERQAEVPQVSMRLTQGLEILDETDWKGQYIPFVGCFGKMFYVDDGSGPTRVIQSAVRLARPAQMLYCYYRTAEAEQVGMATRFPYFVRRGSLSPEEALKLTKSTHEPVAFIEVNAVSDNLPPGLVPEMPQRNSFVPEIAALEAGAEGARRAIQSAMASNPLPTSAQRRNEKSAVALKQIEESSQKGTFHFVDHYEAAIQRTAVIGDDLIPYYYDAARDLTVRKQDDTPIQVRVNDPNAEPVKNLPYGDMPTLTDGDHDVTLSTGPSFESERDAADDFADTLVQHIDVIAKVAGPQVAAKIMSLGIKLKNIGPLGSEMADLIAPPDPDQIPPQAKALIQQLQGQLAELQKKADPNTTKLAIAAHGDALELRIATMNNETKMYVADVAKQSKADVAELKARIDVIAHLAGLEHEERMAEKAHMKDAAQTLHDSAHELAIGAAEHVRAKELADQQHQQALEQGQQAADLAPQPEPTDSGGA